MTGKLHPDLERKCLELAGLGTAKPKRQAKPRLVAPSLTVYEEQLVAVLPIETASEINLRSWRGRSKRTDAAWRTVSRLFGMNLGRVAYFASCYHLGATLRVTFARLGGRKLDRSNLPTACKATEDAVAFMLGADDGDDRWQAEWDQFPGGPCGVRVRIEVVGEN